MTLKVLENTHSNLNGIHKKVYSKNLETLKYQYNIVSLKIKVTVNFWETLGYITNNKLTKKVK